MTTILSDLTKHKQREYESNSESDQDFSVSESEFEPSSSDSDTQENSESEDSSHEEPLKRIDARHLKTPSSKQAIAVPAKSSATTIRRSKRLKTNDFQYVLQSDDYFTNQASHHKTSDHTMDRLKTPRLQQSQIIDLLSAMTVSKEHQESITELHEAYTVNVSFLLFTEMPSFLNLIF